MTLTLMMTSTSCCTLRMHHHKPFFLQLRSEGKVGGISKQFVFYVTSLVVTFSVVILPRNIVKNGLKLVVINDGRACGATRTTVQVHMSVNAKKFMARRLLDKVLERYGVIISSWSSNEWSISSH